MRDEFIGYFDDDNGTYVPVVDMGQPIVRCSDCEHYCPELYYHISCELHCKRANPDDFCSWAERRDEE